MSSYYLRFFNKDNNLLICQFINCVIYNNQTKNTNENYARIIINVKNGQKGDFPKKDDVMQNADLSEWNSIRKEQAQFSVKMFGKEIINWSSPRNIKINDFNIVELNYTRATVSTEKIKVLSGYDPVTYSYDTQHVYNSIVKVSDYTIFDDDKMVTIIISYRDDNVDARYRRKTNPKLDYIINTLDIEN